jgi:hypothetical protein
MTGSSVLPITIHNGKLYFLFGKENELEKSAKGFSDFGGGVEQNEDVYKAALREGGEELTGFLGDGKVLEEHIKKNGGIYKYYDKKTDYHVHMFYLKYDENLPIYYNNNHKFLWDRMKNQLSKTKLFEKIEIKWMCVDEIKKENMQIFRHFYSGIIMNITKEKSKIFNFIKKIKSYKSKRKTKKAKNI